ncbi:hypothetical protein C8A05DRAFT_34062 [Staphylotrichum tortipilum]|uniref:Rhodopsin domain-containing protein n=1 Tax=Staphylotrichum tortipilum TaxID=2831512 RepID=A0AAN6RU68_9PEZI|nr:hypothetical protein C8A05DRAFT_34062 [Staphylotrichum longicolle]
MASPIPSMALLGENETQAPQLIASATLLWVLAASLVALRCYVRTKIVKAFGTEDWTLLVALFCSLGHSVCLATLTAFGYGKHTWWITPDQFVASAKITFAMQVCYMVSLAFTKISILVLYLRILTYHYARWFTWSILVLTVVYNLVAFAIQVTTCIPLKKLWEPGDYGKCHSITLAWALISLHVGTDFLVFALPTPIIVTMTMPLRQKLLLIALFSLGFFACAVSLIRTIYLRVVFSVTADPSWDSLSMSHWNAVEVNVAIVCACLMTMKPLIAKLWPRLLDPAPEHDPEDSVSQGNGESPGGSLSGRFKREL